MAETFEQARAAASLRARRTIAVIKELTPWRTKNRPSISREGAADETTAGDFDGAFSSAAVKIDATYTTQDQSHMAMEPHASMAVWDGNKLTLWTSNQMIHAHQSGKNAKSARGECAYYLPVYRRRGRSGKLFLRSDALLAALAAER